jgi:hypothetical protein
MRKTILAATLALASFSALSADYFVVVPVPNRAATEGNIVVALSGYTLPVGLVGRAYAGFDFNSVLQVKGDPGFSASGVQWTIAGGSLPVGLTLGADGKLGGTPTAAATSGFQVKASYRTKSGAQAYQVIVGEVSVNLAGATLPALTAGTAMAYDLKPSLTVTGDPAYSSASVNWTATNALPAGLALGNDGRITGTPTSVGPSTVAVTAAYLNKTSAPATYSMSVSANINDQGGFRGWSDGSYAASCNGYRNPAQNYLYSGLTGDGVYRIKVGNATYDVLCDMTTDGGGWTLAAKNSATGGSVRTDFLSNTGVVMGTLTNLSAGGARLPTSVINSMFQNGGGVARYKTGGTPYGYYKRLTNPASYDFASAFFTWSDANAGTLNANFALYSSLAALQSNSGAWTYCNYDVNVGFPRDCGPSGPVTYEWFDFDGTPPSVNASLWLR